MTHFLYLTTPEMRTPHYSGHFNLIQRCPDKSIQDVLITHSPLSLFLTSQPDNSTAQYVLRMMISQHKFYVSELEGTPGITWMKNGGRGRSRSAHDLTSTSTKYVVVVCLLLSVFVVCLLLSVFCCLFVYC